MRIHSQPSGHRSPQAGFSLIEVMIAVVVLATGLLALAALQINLTQSSADAKARSRVASLLNSVIDYERTNFSSISALTNTQCTTTSPSAIQTAICTAQNDAGLSSITLNQSVTEYYAAPGDTSFTTPPPTTKPNVYGDYSRVDLTATWTDASGSSRRLGTTTLLGNLGLNVGSTTLLNLNLLTSANLTPYVHETNPSSTAGVIPIAIGNNTNTAATNPKPTVNTASGANSTTFTTLTYTQGVNDTTNTSTIQKRVETEVAECVCQGSSTNPFGSATLEAENVFRPTYWNGTQYTSPKIVSGGTPQSSAAIGIKQSSECDICCRDHNDTGIASGQVLYDAVTGDTNRYQVAKSNSAITTPVSLAKSNGSLVTATVNSDAYLDSCRMIRVDGLWRVATDIQASHLGLIVTNDEAGSSTSPATPNGSYETLYETFVVNAVKQYLLSALPTAGSPDWTSFLTSTLAGLFSTSAPNVPSTNPVTADTLGTYRYLHAHGLYIDHLETEVINKLNAVESSSCPTTATNFPTCLLPYLPFNTINLTGLAAWTDTATDGSTQAQPVLSVGNGTNTSTTTCATGSFFGGCVTGLMSGSALAAASMGHSNSGIAVSIPVSTYELSSTHKLTATQAFSVSGGSTSDVMYAQVTGPDLTPTGFSAVEQFPTNSLNSAINPAVTWAVSTIASGNCSINAAKNAASPNPYKCATTTTLAPPTTITVKGYNQFVSNAATSSKDPCNVGGSSKNKTYTIPGLVCYTLSTATLSTDLAGTNRIDCYGTGGTNNNCFSITSPYTVTNGKQLSATTAVTIASKSGSPNTGLTNSYLNLTYIANGSALGTLDLSTCATTKVPTILAPTDCLP